MNTQSHRPRIAFATWSGVVLWFGVISPTLCRGEPLITLISVTSVATAPEDGTYWMQARPAILPNNTSSIPIAVITLQKTERVGTHMYHGLEAMWSHDLGKTWTDPQPLASVDRLTLTNGMLEAPVDMTPQFHRRSVRLLVTGATFFQDPALHRDVRGAGSGIPTTWNPRVSKRGEDGIGWQLRRMGGDPISGFTVRGVDNEDGWGSSINVDDFNWHHYVGIWDQASGTRRLYVDGVFSHVVNNNPSRRCLWRRPSTWLWGHGSKVERAMKAFLPACCSTFVFTTTPCQKQKSPHS